MARQSSSSSSKSGKTANGQSANGKPAKKAAGGAPSADLTREDLLELYRSMQLIRIFERKVIELFRDGELPGFLHVAIGQEAIAVGVSKALRDDDYIGSTHRAHGHVLARGSDPTGMMAELLGRVTGYCRGKGGSMHLADMTHNVVGANGVVGAGAPMMTGVALTQKMQGGDKLAVAFYGDGASNQGNVYEAMNLAQLWKLPVLFVCENNRYAESTPYWQQVPVEDLTVRGAAFGMKTFSVDGNDVLAVYNTFVEACDFARKGNGPVYVVCETRRIEGHYVGDAEVYRPKGEAKEWKKGDPIPAFEAVLTKNGVSEDEIRAIEAQVDELVEKCVIDARAGELPAAEEAMMHIYAEDNYAGPVVGL